MNRALFNGIFSILYQYKRRAGPPINRHPTTRSRRRRLESRRPGPQTAGPALAAVANDGGRPATARGQQPARASGSAARRQRARARHRGAGAAAEHLLEAGVETARSEEEIHADLEVHRGGEAVLRAL